MLANDSLIVTASCQLTDGCWMESHIIVSNTLKKGIKHILAVNAFPIFGIRNFHNR